MLKELRACLHFAPIHIPIALELIEKTAKTYPNVPQFACFDTTFHKNLPEVASTFPLPRQLFDEDIHRYGFHGISYESLVYQLGRGLPSRTIMAHLGNGASLAAVKDGKSVDTSMGLTPTGGIVMATRSGDLDPGVLLYLMRARHMDAESLEKLLNKDSGFAALSNGNADMRALEAAVAKGDQAAKLAIQVFCRSICKMVAAYAAVLGGIDMLVFAGGIGEHSARVREDVCRDLSFLGVSVDDNSNRSNASDISGADSRVRVRIIPSQEDFQIARHCRAMM
jgi:acetate kinase